MCEQDKNQRFESRHEDRIVSRHEEDEEDSKQARDRCLPAVCDMTILDLREKEAHGPSRECTNIMRYR